MSLSILTRPQGYNISSTPITITRSFEQDGHITFNVESGHGLVNGQIIYLQTNVEDYNGFFSAFVGDAVNFVPNTISSSPQSVPFIRNINEGYLYESGNTHGWNCVHLPIIYKLSSTLWPTNSVDTTRTVSSFTNDNGYVNLNLSGDIKATGTANELEWVKISGSNGLDGIYQIINWISDTDITINLAYSAGYSFAGGTVQYYYNNYHAVIRIYGGLKSDHIWAAQKPYVLISEKKAVPDADGVITVNIAEELKSKIEIISNNLQLGTLPNNIDAFCMFYIEYAESYDDSNGYTLGTVTESFTSDQANFEGKAMNCNLPFKGKQSGSMSEHVLNSSKHGNFLTNFVNPVIFSGKYFDLSFIWDGIRTVFFKLEWYLAGVLQTTEYEDVEEAFYTGVYRHQIQGDCGYERVDVTAYQGTAVGFPIHWLSGANPFDTATATVFTTNATGAPSSTAWTQIIDNLAIGDKVIITLTAVLSAPSASAFVQFQLFRSDLLTEASGAVVNTPTTALTTFTFELTVSNTNAYYLVINAASGDAGSVLTITLDRTIVIPISSNLISETKQLAIECSCYSEWIYLSWLNNLGGYDYWLFTGAKEVGTDIISTQETKKNTFQNWPASYGEFADTIRHETSRVSRRTYLVRSQPLTKAQVMAISEIKSSPYVQIITDEAGWDRRTVIPDQDSFVILDEMNKMHSISFTISLTDDLPSQSQ